MDYLGKLKAGYIILTVGGVGPLTIGLMESLVLVN